MATRPRPCVVWRRGCKPAVPCLESAPNADSNAHYFQVGVSVLEAKRVAWSSHWRHCFVILALDKTRLRTRVRKNMFEPRFREYFDFDLNVSTLRLQQLNLVVAFMELRCCAPPHVLGETRIHLRDIWMQPGHHQQKWHQLTSTKRSDLGPVGLINMSITIGNLHEVLCYTALSTPRGINLCHPRAETQLAKYVISVYRAFGLMKHPRGDAKPPSTFVRVSFCNLSGKTDVQQRTHNPIYNEKISIVDMFPSACPRITFEVHTECRFNILASCHLELSDISHEGENGFVPTFGPSLLQLYCRSNCKCKKRNLQEGGPFYCGALLVALETCVPYKKPEKVKCACVEPEESLSLDSMWQLEEFCLFCPLFEVSLLECKSTLKEVGVAITMEELAGFENKTSEEFTNLKSSIRELKLHYTGPMIPTPIDEKRKLSVLYFGNACPVLQLALALPDFRFRIYRNNLFLGLIEEMENIIATVESHTKTKMKSDILGLVNKAYDSASAAVLKSIDMLRHSKAGLRTVGETVLDQKQCELQKQELHDIYMKLLEQPRIKCFGCAIGDQKNHLARMMGDLKEIFERLRKLVTKCPDGWPNIIIWLLDCGSRVAYARISAADVLHSDVPEKCGRKCGKVQTLYLKSISCGPAVPNNLNECLRFPAKIETLMWLGLHKQSSCFAGSIPGGYMFKLDKNRMFLETSARVLECRVFVYKAYLSCSVADTLSFVRVYALGSVKETLYKENPNPVWDQTLRIECGMHVSVDKVIKYPPEVLIEVYSRPRKASSKTPDDLIGRVAIKSVVDLTSITPVAPQLQYHELYNMFTDECKGQIMVSAQIVEISENILNMASYRSNEAFSAISTIKRSHQQTNLVPMKQQPCDVATYFSPEHKKASTMTSKHQQDVATNNPSYDQHEVSTNISPGRPHDATSSVPKREFHEAIISVPSRQPHDVTTNVPSSQHCETTTNIPSRAPREVAVNVPHRDIADTLSQPHESVVPNRGAPTLISMCQLGDTNTNGLLYQPRDTLPNLQSLVATWDDKQDAVNTVVERIPSYLIPQITSYKLDIFWWGLREVDNAIMKTLAILEIDKQVIKSDIIDIECLNCNFFNNRVTQMIQTSFDKDFSASISFSLYSSSSFGRTELCGSKVVKNSRKFLIDWVPKSDRKNLLRSTSVIQSDDLIRSLVSSEINSKHHGSYTHIPHDKNSSSNKSDTLESKECKFLAVESFAKPQTHATHSKDKKWYQKFYDKDIEEEKLMLLTDYNEEKSYNIFREKYVGRYTSVYNATIEKEQGDKTELKTTNLLRCLDHYWWTRYFISEEMVKNHEATHKEDINIITIYNTELEAQPKFSKFKDWCKTIKLYKSRQNGVPKNDSNLCCGILKVGVVIYKWPPPDYTVAVSQCGADLQKSYFEDYPRNNPSKYLIRVYVVKGIDLMLNDTVGLPDSYVAVKCGKKHLCYREKYVAKNGNPVFAQMFEFNCTLPEDYLATVSVYNHDQSSADTLIGETNIDLENRVYSKHRASVGLASKYRQNGRNKWRDSMKPSSILEEVCYRNHIPPPIFPDHSTVIVNEMAYRLRNVQSYTAEEQRENICLNLLHQWHSLPLCGYALVPEHVETRKLYKPQNPGVEQGKLQMWVDIFPLPLNVKIPGPVDITPPIAKEYELRVTIRELTGFTLRSRDKQAMEVYVTTWIGNQDEAQVTDVHSMYGPSALPWIMLFHFKYQNAEKKIIIEEKNAFTEIIETKTPILEVRVVNFNGAPYTYLGALRLNLQDMTKPAHLSSRSALKLAQSATRTDLFNAGSARGWWALVDENLSYVGAIQLELDLCRQGENNQMVRVGRSKMIVSSGSSYSSQPSVVPGQSHAANSYIALLNSYRMRIFVGICIVAIVYYFFTVRCLELHA